MVELCTPDEIWQGDLFDRRIEAEQIIAYIESVLGRPNLREDKRAYTITIDARYGEGKSFFLRRLSQHLAINHPIAFVDAWADDLADEPLTALVATLKEALSPFADEPAVQARLQSFMTKSSKVVQIAALGLLKRGVGLALTAGAVDAASHVISGASDEIKDAINDSAKDAANAQVDEIGKAVRGLTAHNIMDERVASFQAGKAAVSEMKDSLSSIISSINREARNSPIIIVIDELDRCRPTYAVKLLEEIKHLFDVSGIVFILAMHSEQLSFSIGGAYGFGFDGQAYLRRFIDREYRLATPNLVPLLEKLCQSAGIQQHHFEVPTVALSQTREVNPTLPALIAEYMRMYGLGPRDAFQLVDLLQTAIALAENRQLTLPYLLPLAIGLMRGKEAGHLPQVVNQGRWVYLMYTTGGSEEVGFVEMAKRIADAIEVDLNSVMQSGQNIDPVLRLIARQRVPSVRDQPLWTVYGHPRLVRSVGRFTNPKLDA